MHAFTTARPMAGSTIGRLLVKRFPRTVDFLRNLRDPVAPLHADRGDSKRALSWARLIVEAPRRTQSSICDLLLSGVFARFPKLKLVSVENDIGWIAHLMERLDTVYDTNRSWMGLPTLPALPSELFKQHVYATFTTDRAGLATRHLVGIDRLMWGSDYPHASSSWPESIRIVERDFVGVPIEEQQQMLVNNACNLYGMDLSR